MVGCLVSRLFELRVCSRSEVSDQIDDPSIAIRIYNMIFPT